MERTRSDVATLCARRGLDPDAAVKFRPDALSDGVQLSDLAARIMMLLMVGKLRAAKDAQEQAVAVAELERLAPKLERHVVKWELDRRRSTRMRFAAIVRRLPGRPQARARARRARRVTLQQSPAHSPDRPSPPDDDPVARSERAVRRAGAAA